jgi:hypothetical protein
MVKWKKCEQVPLAHALLGEESPSTCFAPWKGRLIMFHDGYFVAATFCPGLEQGEGVQAAKGERLTRKHDPLCALW